MQLEQKHKLWFYALCTIAVAFGLWLFNPGNYYFLNDDLVHIPLSRDGVLFQRNSFRPVCDLSVQLDYLLWGKKAWGYHFSNLLLHAANTGLLFILSKAVVAKYGNVGSANFISIAVAVLFFVYAFHSEAIFWILGRSGSLGLLMFIPSLLFYLKRHQSVKFLLLSLLFFSIALLTYESNWIFPLVAVVVAFADRRLHDSSTKKEAVYLAPILLIFIVYLIARFVVLGEIAGAYEAAHFTNFQIDTIAANFARLFLRSFVPSFANSNYFLGAGMFLLVALCAAMVVYRSRLRKEDLLLMSFVLLTISFAPYLSLGIDTHTVEGERFLYMPTAFACMFLIYAVVFLFKSGRTMLLIFSILIVYHLIFLHRAHVYYSTASSVVKTTFAEMNSLRNKKRLFIDSLPQTNNGALIFRLGFEEGVHWLKEPGTVDTVIVSSLKVDNGGWAKPYTSVNPESVPSRSFNNKLVRYPKGHQGYFRQPLPRTIFNIETDAMFLFQSNSLQVFK